MDARRTALVVAVPEAEDVVGPHRLRLDPLTALGVPAHVTVLFPFAPAATVDEALRSRLSGLFAGVPAFEFSLDRTGWFGTDVLWLAPEPEHDFRNLTRLVSEAFPEYPPYGGEFDDVVPHLTVADGAPRADMLAAEQHVSAALPIRSAARSVTLLVEEGSGHWRPGGSFSLGPDRLGHPGARARADGERMPGSTTE